MAQTPITANLFAVVYSYANINGFRGYPVGPRYDFSSNGSIPEEPYTVMLYLVPAPIKYKITVARGVKIPIGSSRFLTSQTGVFWVRNGNHITVSIRIDFDRSKYFEMANNELRIRFGSGLPRASVLGNDIHPVSVVNTSDNTVLVRGWGVQLMNARTALFIHEADNEPVIGTGQFMALLGKTANTSEALGSFLTTFTYLTE